MTKQLAIPEIPNEVADTIEWARSKLFPLSNAKIIEVTLNGKVDGSYPKVFRSIPFDTLLAALINGYTREVAEKTPEELAEEERLQKHNRIRDVYDVRLSHARYDNYVHASDRHAAFANGIVFTLNELGLKIEGVNTTTEELNV